MSQKPSITLEWVEEQEAFHRKKLEGLAVMKEALLGMVITEVPGVAPKPNPSLQFDGTKKRTILGAIAASVPGLSTQQVIAACISGGLKETTQGNTSPQLSLYKSKGLLDLKDGLWKITPEGREYLAPTKN